MNNEKKLLALQDKMSAELDKYREWLVQQPPKEILEHTHEYTVKENIVLLLDDAELSGRQITALLSSPIPLDDVYKVFRNMDTGLMDTIQMCLEDRADTMLKLQREKQRNTPQKKSVMERLQEKTSESSPPKHTPAKGADAR